MPSGSFRWRFGVRRDGPTRDRIDRPEPRFGVPIGFDRFTFEFHTSGCPAHAAADRALSADPGRPDLPGFGKRRRGFAGPEGHVTGAWRKAERGPAQGLMTSGLRVALSASPQTSRPPAAACD